MRTLLIEDARLARQELRELLQAHPAIEVVGEAEDGPAALSLIRETRPALLFLDIHLPGMDGFAVLEALDEVPLVIFTTAYDQYAIKSFEYNALDYLLKPIEAPRLAKAVTRALAQHRPPPTQQLGAASQVFVKDGARCWFVTLGEVRRFESVGNYTRLYFGEHRPLIHKSLNHLETVLDPAVFFRINRQEMINLRQVAGIAAWFNGRLRLRLHSGEEVEVSRRHSQRIREWFSL